MDTYLFDRLELAVVVWFPCAASSARAAVRLRLLPCALPGMPCRMWNRAAPPRGHRHARLSSPGHRALGARSSGSAIARRAQPRRWKAARIRLSSYHDPCAHDAGTTAPMGQGWERPQAQTPRRETASPRDEPRCATNAIKLLDGLAHACHYLLRATTRI